MLIKEICLIQPKENSGEVVSSQPKSEQQECGEQRPPPRPSSIPDRLLFIDRDSTLLKRFEWGHKGRGSIYQTKDGAEPVFKKMG